METEVIYLGHDNSIDLVLMSDGAPVALGAVTRVVLVVGATTLDSGVLGFGADQPFDTTKTVPVGPHKGADMLRLSLGGAEISAQRAGAARLVTYDADHPNGLVWTEALRVEVTP